MPLKKQKGVSKYKWQRTRPSNHTAARLKRQPLSESEQESSESETIMAAKAGSQPATVDELKEMLTSTKEAIFKRMDDNAEKVDKRLDQLATNIAHNDKQIKILKVEVDQLGKQMRQMEEKYSLEFDEHEKRLISLEDQSRRSSIRIKNLPELTGEERRNLIPRWLKEIIPNLVMGEEDIERVHRVGTFRDGSRPRDILVKFSNYYKKEQLMTKLRSLPLLKFQGSTVHVYNDLCYQTIKWRCSVKPITEELKRREIKYTWGYPVFMRFMYVGKQYRITSLEQGTELLKRLGLELQDDAVLKSANGGGSGATASGK